ncbi:hypothetical protein T12_15686 [Trichinella patagoniensis]|uniref:Uncharacterized protein n=1 Tax=Trichinella patagoniensis TaxID=990121 RepID=A0A0V0Z849_9BILA|nr:hypothetical protein T12_15686 [Trichinella patagoniensis]
MLRSFMYTVNGHCQIFFAFPIASHELPKAISVQRKNEQTTNCQQLHHSTTTAVNNIYQYTIIANRNCRKMKKVKHMQDSWNNSIVPIPLKYSPLFRVSKKILPEFRYIENRTLQKTGKSAEAEESVDEVEASSLYTAIVDMLYWKWRFFKIAFFPHCMPGAHLHYSSLRDLPDKFELSFCRSVHGT